MSAFLFRSFIDPVISDFLIRCKLIIDCAPYTVPLTVTLIENIALCKTTTLVREKTQT